MRGARAAPAARTLVALRAYRSVLTAVVVVALLAGLAGAASPLVTAAIAGEAFENELENLSPLAIGLQVDSDESHLRPPTTRVLEQRAAMRDRAAAALAGRLPGVGEPVATTSIRRLVQASTARGFTIVNLMARTGAIEHVHVIAETGGPGVWLAHRTARELRVRPGDTVTLLGNREATVRVKGIYRALSDEIGSPYWVNFGREIYPEGFDPVPPPPFAFATRGEVFALARQLGLGDLRHVYELPVESGRLTLDGARSLDGRFTAIGRAVQRPGTRLARNLGCEKPRERVVPGAEPGGCTTASSLGPAVTLADSSLDAVSPVVALLSALGIAIALGVAAAAGVFAVRRRRVEAELRYARGEHVARFSARTAAEAVLPMLAGAAAGLAAAVWVARLYTERGVIAGSTVWSAAAQAGAVAAAALLLFAGAAGVAFVRRHATGVRRRRWVRWIPWEAPVLLLGAVLLARILTGAGLAESGSAETQHPTLAVFVCPLLLVAGTAGLAVRLGRRLLGSHDGRRGERLPTAAYLAVRRLAAARGLLVVLAVLGAVAFGGLAYSETLAYSLSATAEQKGYIAHGSDVGAIVQSSDPLPRDFPYPVTRVQYDNGSGAANTPIGPQLDIVLVDPETFARAIHWSPRWGPDPAEIVGRLTPSAQVLPVITVGDVPPLRRVSVGTTLLRANVVAAVRTFPGTTTSPAIVTSYEALARAAHRREAGSVLELARTYFWAKGPPGEVARALAESVDAYAIMTVDDFRRDPDVVLATRTYSYMRILALAAGVLAAAGLLLYLQARQRSQVIASALSARMGLRRRTEIASLSLELVAVVAFCAAVGGAVALAAAAPIVRRIDPLSQFTPGPVLAIPTAAILAAALALAAAAALAGLLTSWLAHRADPVEALRVE